MSATRIFRVWLFRLGPINCIPQKRLQQVCSGSHHGHTAQQFGADGSGLGHAQVVLATPLYRVHRVSMRPELLPQRLSDEWKAS